PREPPGRPEWAHPGASARGDARVTRARRFPALETRVALIRYLPTNVVTDGPPSMALKEPPLTETAVLETRLLLESVTQGVSEAGAVPPEMVIGTVTDEVLLLIATTTTVLSEPRYADSWTLDGGVPVTSTR